MYTTLTFNITYYGAWTKWLISKKHKFIIRPFGTVSNKFCIILYKSLTSQTNAIWIDRLNGTENYERWKKKNLEQVEPIKYGKCDCSMQSGNKECLFPHCSLLKIKDRERSGSVWLLLSFALVDVRLGLLSAPYVAYEFFFQRLFKVVFTTKTIGKLLLY